MTQRFQIYGSEGGGRSFGRRPIVLARLPRVGIAARNVEVTRTESQPVTFAQATRFYFDPHHVEASARQTEPAEQEADRRATSHRRHHGSHHRPRTEAPCAKLHQPRPQDSVPVRMAPYSGLLVTLVLAASAVLFYWMIIIPGHTPPADFANTYQAYGATKIELPQFDFPAGPPTAPQVSAPVATVDPFQAKPAAQTPTVAPQVVEVNLVPTSTAFASTPTETQTTAEAAAPAIEPNAELVPLPEIVPAPANAPEVIYNDVSASSYPTTDHPLASDMTVLGVVDASPNDGAMFFSVPQVARQPEATVIR